jgi:hypothetical protein
LLRLEYEGLLLEIEPNALGIKLSVREVLIPYGIIHFARYEREQGWHYVRVSTNSVKAVQNIPSHDHGDIRFRVDEIDPIYSEKLALLITRVAKEHKELTS